jgi:hypothetical protein
VSPNWEAMRRAWVHRAGRILALDTVVSVRPNRV